MVPPMKCRIRLPDASVASEARSIVTLLQIHVVAASAWLGLIAAETVIELMAKDRTSRQFVARVHKTIDLYFEGPLVAIVLTSGSLLLYRLWPGVSPLLWVKVVTASLGIASNVACIHWVVRRAAAKDDAEFAAYARKVSLTGYTIPLAVVALAIGLYGV